MRLGGFVESGIADALGRLTGWRRHAVSMGLGAVATLAMPPVFAVPVLLVVFPGLLWLLRGTRGPAAAFLTGWTFGFGYFVVGLYWIVFALSVDWARFWWLAPPTVAGLPAVLALLPALVAALWRRLNLPGIAGILAFAALWGLSEWLRGHILTGFPWNLIGYGWAGWPSVLQAGSVIGVYGLSVVTVAVAALPACLAGDDSSRRRPLAALTAGLLIFAAIAWAGGHRLDAAASGPPPDVTVRLVQPNVGQKEKWDRAQWPDIFARHLSMSVAAGRDPNLGIDLVIWPEAAVPIPIEEEPGIRAALAEAVPPGGLLITGAPRRSPAGAPLQLWNSLHAIDGTGGLIATYDKAHLVPFGEYVPLRGILPIDKVAPGQVDFSPGPGPRTIDLPGLPPVSPLICYEVIFPGAVTAPDSRPAWLLNITNDAWYGVTAGPISISPSPGCARWRKGCRWSGSPARGSAAWSTGMAASPPVSAWANEASSTPPCPPPCRQRPMPAGATPAFGC